ncbi:MAG TPA: hypothetical protein DCM64_05680 [Gammaproteobacteria bacterium]|jgi:hypothetical protein|nr:hypothetical protein [Gammaproteobacteria bacterium]|tara:strand:+ start:1351 stop:1605 length:255 start_codon:yes stop_codon:yes gene_type:complete
MGFALVAILTGCENIYQDDGIPQIRSQRDVDAYNATVTAEADKLVCNRERVIGSNIRQWVCMTVAQQDRLTQEARDVVDRVFVQ